MRKDIPPELAQMIYEDSDEYREIKRLENEAKEEQRRINRKRAANAYRKQNRKPNRAERRRLASKRSY